jgi:hypothetical protein
MPVPLRVDFVSSLTPLNRGSLLEAVGMIIR